MEHDPDKIVSFPLGMRTNKPSPIIAEAIRSLRQDRKLTQAALAEAIGISERKIELIENAHITASAVELKKLAELFSVDYLTFFAGANATDSDAEIDIELVKIACHELIDQVSDKSGLLLVKDALSKLVV